MNRQFLMVLAKVKTAVPASLEALAELVRPEARRVGSQAPSKAIGPWSNVFEYLNKKMQNI